MRVVASRSRSKNSRAGWNRRSEGVEQDRKSLGVGEVEVEERGRRFISVLPRK